MRTFTTAAAVAALMALSPAAFAADQSAQEPTLEQKVEQTANTVEQKAEEAGREMKQEAKEAGQEIKEEANQASREVKEEASEAKTAAEAEMNEPADPAAPQTAVADTDGMKDIVGMAVIGQDGEKVGEVSDVLVGDDGMMQSVVIDQGGFLGIGEKSIALELSALDIQEDGVHIDMTNDQLAELPEWEPEPNEAAQQPQSAEMPPAATTAPPAATAPAQ